jgi:hypothetical protein
VPRPVTAETPPAPPAVIRWANELVAAPALLQLRSGRLVADLRARGCACRTARAAVGLARRWVTPARPLLTSDLPEYLP